MDFLAGVAFFAVDFLAAVFLAGAAFLVVDFLAAVFFAGALFFAVLFVAVLEDSAGFFFPPGSALPARAYADPAAEVTVPAAARAAAGAALGNDFGSAT